MSLMKCSTTNPGSKLRFSTRGARFSSVQHAGRAAANRLQHRLEIQPGARAVEQAFADANHGAGDHDLIAHLRVLAGAGPALVDDVLAHDLEERRHARDRVGVAADHDRQRRVARADVAARHRRVDGGGTLGARGRRDLDREARLGRRHVDGDRRRLAATAARRRRRNRRRARRPGSPPS